MTTAYTSLLGLALPVTGELSGTWGDTVNTAITSLLDSAVAGTTSITVDADITLTSTTGATNEARQAIILWNPASGTVTRNITAPAQSKLYTVINASGGTQSIVIRGAGPTTGVTIAKGESAQVAWNGSDFVKVGSSGGAATFTNLTVTGNTILGDAAADTLTVNATSTFAAPVSFQGLVNLPSTGRSAAAALTPTNPAFLYGVASTYTDTTSSGTLAPVAPFYGIAQPTLSTSNVTTYTNAATLYIANAPAAGGSATITNPYALYVAAGANYFGGAATFNSTLAVNGNTTLGDATGDTLTINAGTTTLVQGTADGVAYLNGSKVLTTGSALTFDGSTLTNVNGAIRASGSTVPSSGAGLELLYGASGSGISTILSYSRTASAYQPLWIDASYQAYFISGSEQVRLNSTGFGIGTNAPSVKLQVEGAANSAPLTLLRLNNSGTTGGGPGIASRISFTAGATALGFIQGCNFASGEAGLQFSGDGTNVQATLNSIGSFGLGTNPNAWGSTVKAIQLGTGGSISNWTGSNGILSVASNMYDAGGGTQRYINTAAAARFDVNNGSFAWNVAGSGTAGAAITFAEAMALTATTPTILRVKGSTSNNGGGAFYVTKAGSAGTHSAFGDAAAILGGTPDLVTTLWSDSNAPITFYVGSERARFSTAGNLTVGGGGLGAAGDPRVSVISKSNYFWGSANGLGDFYIGDGTYGIAVGVATGGGGAGTSRIWAQNNGVANVLALGVANNDKLLIYPNQVTVQSAGDATLAVTSIAGAFSSTLDLQSSSAGAGTINTSQYFRYTIAGTERARLTGSGDWLVGGTSVGATDPGSPQINLISAVTSTGQWTSRIVARNTGNDTSSFLGNYRDSTRSVAGVYAHNAPLSAWSTLYVNTIDGTYSAAGGNGGNVVLSGQVFLGKVAFNLSQNGCAFVNGDTTFTISAGNTLHVYDGPNGAYRFYVSSAGQINATSTTISGISDQRLKENIQDIDAGLDAVMALKPRKFDWKAGKGKGIKGDRGWIAQEFEQVFPDMIEPWKEEAPEGEEPYKAVRADLIPVLVKAIQEQQTIIESLKARLDAANL